MMGNDGIISSGYDRHLYGCFFLGMDGRPALQSLAAGKRALARFFYAVN